MSDQPNTPAQPSRGSGSEPQIKDSETVHHQQTSTKKNKRPQGVGELNLTSMLDVTFQLLIFFILTASFAKGEGILPADLPAGPSAQSSEDPEPPEQPLNIMLRSLGGQDISIEVEGMSSPPANFNELHQKLKSVQRTDSNPTAPFAPDDPVIIHPDQTVGWGHVVNAFNAAIRAEYSNVHFAQPEDN
jgi:biopolymer transport protein ExbD